MSQQYKPNELTAKQSAADSTPDSIEGNRDQEVQRQSEEKYRRLFESIDEAFCTIEVLFDNQGKAVDYRFLETNPAFLRQTGLNNVIGQRALEVVPKLEPFWFDTYGHVAKTGEAIRFEHQALAMNRYYDVYAFRVDEPTQNHVAVIFNDITQRKRQQQTQAFLLKLSDALRPLSDSAQIERTAMQVLGQELGVNRAFFATIDADGESWSIRHDYTNGVASQVGRYPMTEFQRSRLPQWQSGRMSSIADSETDAGLSAADRGAYAVLGTRAAIGVPLVKGARFAALLSVNQTGPRTWTEAELDLTREAAERTWVAIERSRAEEALHESQKRFESIANLVPDLLWDSVPDGATNWYNQRWLEYTGQRFEEAIGWGWLDAIHPDDREASAKRYNEAIKVGQSLRQEHRMRRHDGAYRWFVVSASPLKDPNGQVVNMYGAATDIHDRKLLEADRRKDEFLAMLSHELRNPLAPIRNGLQLLARTHQDDQTLGTLLPIMNRQMDHLLHMMDDLLDVSRISQGKINLHKKRIDLVQVVTQAVDVIRPLYTASGRQLTVQLPNDPVYLDGDSTRLHQVVTNLLTNGLRYTHETGQVWLSLAALGEQAVLRVSDNGIGLAADQLEAIFELFVQVNTSLARSHGGLGLGLALVQELVQQHGGRVEAHSQGFEQGSEFVVYLPILPA